MGVSPPQMLPEPSSNASALVQSKSQVRRPLRYGATGVQSHPILVTVTVCRLWPTSAPKRRPAIDPKRAFTRLFHSSSRNTMAVLSSGSPWMEENRVKTATRLSLFHAHITSLFLEWKSADISVLHLLWCSSSFYDHNKVATTTINAEQIVQGRNHRSFSLTW